MGEVEDEDEAEDEYADQGDEYADEADEYPEEDDGAEEPAPARSGRRG